MGREINNTTGEYNSTSRLSGGYVSFWLWLDGCIFSLRPEKKKFQSSVWRVCQVLVLAGWRETFITTGKKKVPVVCLAGVSVFGSGGKSAVIFFRREKK